MVFECFEMSSPEVTRILWQMKNAGYFNNVNGIIFEDHYFLFVEICMYEPENENSIDGNIIVLKRD